MGIDPVILFFILGALAGAVKAELHLPKAVYELLTVILLLAIGLKGGVELADSDLLRILPGLGLIAIKGLILGAIAFGLLRLSRKLPRADAASIAAHYGSVSVGTFAVAMAYLENQGIPFEAHAAAWVVVLEVPAILLGVLLVRGFRSTVGWGGLAREVFLGKGVVLLLGGLFIGLLAGPAAMEPLEPLFFDAFRGVLALFLLEMGLVAAGRAGGLRDHGLFIAAFGIIFPLIGAVVGGFFAWILGLSLGGAVLLVTLSASASYIAAPAAMRLSVPEANPSLSLTASLALTFPFNVIIGIPLYHYVLTLVYPVAGG